MDSKHRGSAFRLRKRAPNTECTQEQNGSDICRHFEVIQKATRVDLDGMCFEVSVLLHDRFGSIKQYVRVRHSDGA